MPVMPTIAELVELTSTSDCRALAEKLLYFAKTDPAIVFTPIE